MKVDLCAFSSISSISDELIYPEEEILIILLITKLFIQMLLLLGVNCWQPTAQQQ